MPENRLSDGVAAPRGGRLSPSAQDGQQADHGQDDDDDHDNGPEQVHSLGSSDRRGGRLFPPSRPSNPNHARRMLKAPSWGAGGRAVERAG